MFDHLSLGVKDLARAVRFYDEALKPMGYSLQTMNEREAAYGPDGEPTFWLYPVPAGQSVVGAGTHVAFAAHDLATVEACHAAALSSGGTSFRAPGRRPDISPSYFGALLLDPDGHKLEFVTTV